MSLNFAMFREHSNAVLRSVPDQLPVSGGRHSWSGQPELAAGISLPLQRQVPARMAASIHLFSTPQTCPASGLLPAAPKVPDPAVAGDVEPARQEPAAGALEQAGGVCGRGDGVDSGRTRRSC